MPSRAHLASPLVALVALFALGGCAPAQLAPRVPFVPPRCQEEAEAPSGERVITRFYEAFARHDFPGMACNYDPEIVFTDSIFGELHGKRAFAMWSMLVSQGGDLEVRHSGVRVDGAEGHAHWDALYTFPFLVFSNKVENSIDATFELRDGRIVRHRDQFDLRRWMRMALWPFGGGVSEDTIRSGVQSRLDDYIAKHPEFQDAKRP
jgi:limonene-1,2-epoxide hydrolase